MSVETKSALDEAVAAHLSSECEGAILAGYVIQCAGQSLERLEAQQTSMLWGCMEAQPVYISLGLARALTLNVDGHHTDSEALDGE